MEKPRVILHWDADGEFHYAATLGVEVVCVDERCADDRVYRTEGGIHPDVIEAVASGKMRDLSDAASAHARRRSA